MKIIVKLSIILIVKKISRKKLTNVYRNQKNISHNLSTYISPYQSQLKYIH